MSALNTSVVEMVKSIKKGEITSEELVKNYIKEIKKKEEDTWGMYIENKDYRKKRNLPDGHTARAMLRQGDGLIYRGCECEHW